MPSKFSDISYKIPDFYVLKIDKEANRLIKEGKDIVKLNLGKSEVPMGKTIADEFSQKIYDHVERERVDPQGLFELREAIALDYRKSTGAVLSSEQIFINNGTSPFFLQLYFLLLNHGDEILLPRPYYPPYAAAVGVRGARAKFYSVYSGRVNLGEIKEQFVPGKTKVIFLNSPGNPLGNVIRKDEFKEILNFVDGRAHIISDEIYDGLVYNNDFTSIFSVYDKERDSVIVLNGFSKIHHMYTRRLGYAIVPPPLAESMLRFQRHNLVCVDPVTQFAGLLSIKNKKKLMGGEIGEEVATYKERLDASKKLLHGTKIKVIEPSGSFYMGVDVSACLNEELKDSMSLAGYLLRTAHVAVAPGEDFGRSDFFRISLTGTRVLEGVQRMRNALESLS